MKNIKNGTEAKLHLMELQKKIMELLQKKLYEIKVRYPESTGVFVRGYNSAGEDRITLYKYHDLVESYTMISKDTAVIWYFNSGNEQYECNMPLEVNITKNTKKYYAGNDVVLAYGQGGILRDAMSDFEGSLSELYKYCVDNKGLKNKCTKDQVRILLDGVTKCDTKHYGVEYGVDVLLPILLALEDGLYIPYDRKWDESKYNIALYGKSRDDKDIFLGYYTSNVPAQVLGLLHSMMYLYVDAVLYGDEELAREIYDKNILKEIPPTVYYGDFIDIEPIEKQDGVVYEIVKLERYPTTMKIVNDYIKNYI